MAEYRIMDLSAFLDEFRNEAEENLERLDQGLLALERNPSDAALVRGLFLSAHTIKGGAGMLDLKVIKQITHALEDVLGLLRDGGERLESATASLLLRTVDVLREIVRTDAALEQPSPEMFELIAALQNRARGVIPSAEVLNNPVVSSKLALLLEPSATAQLVQSEQLERAGFTVQGFSSFDTALDRLAQSAVQLVVVTLEPGGIDGLALIQEMRAANMNTPAIVTMLELSEDVRLKVAGLNASVVQKSSWQDSQLFEMARGLNL